MKSSKIKDNKEKEIINNKDIMKQIKLSEKNIKSGKIKKFMF